MINFILIFSFFSLGLLAQRLFSLPKKLPITLNQLVINIAIPAVILLRIPQLQLSSELLFPIVAAWLTVTVAACCVYLLGKKLSWSKGVIGALMMTAVLGNTSYLGFPMVKMFYGEALLPYAIIFDQLGNFIALAVYGTLIISLFSDNDKKPNVITIVVRVFRFPPFIALIFALFVGAGFISKAFIPPIITPLLSWFALAMVPLTMFIVGLQFQLQLDPHYRKPLMLGLTIKMLITPLVILLVAWLAPVASDIAKVSVFEAAMPPMVTAGVMAMQANLAPKLASAMVGFGLFLSFIFLPLVYWVNNLVL
ncbi:MAG: AEC family transporter [Alteromonadaceae bacterium]|nr:AEC family transporter [Alteromonadaceae bacterium]